MKAYQLKVMIKNSKPPIWRRVIVPAGLSFSQLELVLNEVMGWSGAHLGMFEFKSPNIRIEELDEERIDDFFYRDTLNAPETIIDEFLDNAKWFSYVYDFGDWWDHRVTIEKVLNDYPNRYPQVIKMKGETLPEDCGGIYGYYELMRILDNPEDPMHKEMSDWMGYMAPIDCDLEELNETLEELSLTDKVHLPMGKKELYEAYYDNEPLYTIVSEDNWQKLQYEEDNEAATTDEWKILYEVSERVKQLAPWEELWDHNIIGLPGKGAGRTAFISIQGHVGDYRGIIVYESADALNQLLISKNQAKINISNDMLTYGQTALVCYWGDREELTEGQAARVKELGYTYKGEKEWLYFNSFKKGFCPCDLNRQEVLRMTEYMGCFEKAFSESRQELINMNFNEEKIAYIDTDLPEKPEMVKIDAPLEVQTVPELEVSDFVTAGQLRSAERSEYSLEAEIIAPGVQYNDEEYSRPINIAVCLLADAASGDLVLRHVTDPEDDPYMVIADAVVEFILREGAPKEIYVSNDIMRAALRHICGLADVKLIKKKKLKHMDKLTDDFLEIVRNR